MSTSSDDSGPEGGQARASHAPIAKIVRSGPGISGLSVIPSISSTRARRRLARFFDPQAFLDYHPFDIHRRYHGQVPFQFLIAPERGRITRSAHAVACAGLQAMRHRRCGPCIRACQVAIIERIRFRFELRPPHGRCPVRLNRCPDVFMYRFISCLVLSSNEVRTASRHSCRHRPLSWLIRR